MEPIWYYWDVYDTNDPTKGGTESAQLIWNIGDTFHPAKIIRKAVIAMGNEDTNIGSNNRT